MSALDGGLQGPDASAPGSLQQGAILATKLFAPLPSLTPRPRLLARMDAGLRGPLTLLAAPAGWGKTTVVSAWRAEALASGVDTRPVAWVSLDSGDNDPVRFWTYALTALNTAQSIIGDGALALLRALQPPPIETILTALLNALAAAPTEVILVLDDYHVIEAGAAHARSPSCSTICLPSCTWSSPPGKTRRCPSRGCGRRAL
jgi:ATP/maltotriose-dependent transcriptional regulator MalT